jgi:hypothetical protein
MQHSPNDTKEHADKFEGTDDFDEDVGEGVVDDEEGECYEEAGDWEGCETHVECELVGVLWDWCGSGECGCWRWEIAVDVEMEGRGLGEVMWLFFYGRVGGM